MRVRDPPLSNSFYVVQSIDQPTSKLFIISLCSGQKSHNVHYCDHNNVSIFATRIMSKKFKDACAHEYNPED